MELIMARRASNTVRNLRETAHHPLDRNGIPILDSPREANRLSKRCHPSRHEYVRLERRFVNYVDAVNYDGVIYSVQSRCRLCGAAHTETEIEA